MIRQAVGIRTLIELVGLKDAWIHSFLYSGWIAPLLRHVLALSPLSLSYSR